MSYTPGDRTSGEGVGGGGGPGTCGALWGSACKCPSTGTDVMAVIALHDDEEEARCLGS